MLLKKYETDKEGLKNEHFDGENYESTKEKTLRGFQKRIARKPEQVLRYPSIPDQLTDTHLVELHYGFQTKFLQKSLIALVELPEYLN